MKSVPLTVGLVTFYAILFQVAIYTSFPDNIIFGMFFLAPFLVLYMAYVMLKYGKPSAYNFEEKFYDDVNIVRHGRESMETP
jgi:hypothetical protein